MRLFLEPLIFGEAKSADSRSMGFWTDGRTRARTNFGKCVFRNPHSRTQSKKNGAGKNSRTPSNARAKLFSVKENGTARRSAVVALLAATWSRGLIRRVGTHNLTAVISAATSRPSLSAISRKLRRTSFELRRADLTFLEGGRVSSLGEFWFKRDSSRS